MSFGRIRKGSSAPYRPLWLEHLEDRILFSVLVLDSPTSLVPIQIGTTTSGGVTVKLNGVETDYAPHQWDSVHVQLHASGIGVNATVVPTVIQGSAMFSPTVEVGDEHGLQDIKAPLTVFGHLLLRLSDEGDAGDRIAILGLQNSYNGPRQIVEGLAPAPITYTADANMEIDITTGTGNNQFSIDGTLPMPPQTPQVIGLALRGHSDQVIVNAAASGTEIDIPGGGTFDSVELNYAKGTISDQASIEFDGTGEGRNSLTVSGAGAADVFKTGAGQVMHDGSGVQYTGVKSLTLSAGTFQVNDDLGGVGLVATGGARVNITVSQSLASRSLLGGCVVTLTPSSTPGGKTIITSAFNPAYGKLDLTNNSILAQYGAQGDGGGVITGYIHPDPLRARWTGVGIFTSSSDASHLLGFVDNYHGLIPSLPRYSVLIKFTVRGDANLDGKVDFADLTLLAQHYGQPPDLRWSDGDFNYDRKVDFADLLSLAQNYGQTVGGPPATVVAYALAARPPVRQ